MLTVLILGYLLVLTSKFMNKYFIANNVDYVPWDTTYFAHHTVQDALLVELQSSAVNVFCIDLISVVTTDLKE